MKKKYYTATATMRDATHEWAVVIYSRYETEEDAQAGAARFMDRYGSQVVKIEIK